MVVKANAALYGEEWFRWNEFDIVLARYWRQLRIWLFFSSKKKCKEKCIKTNLWNQVLSFSFERKLIFIKLRARLGNIEVIPSVNIYIIGLKLKRLIIVVIKLTFDNSSYYEFHWRKVLNWRRKLNIYVLIKLNWNLLIQCVRIYIFKTVLIFLALAHNEFSKFDNISFVSIVVINFTNLIKRISLINEFHCTSILIIKRGSTWNSQWNIRTIEVDINM